MRLTPDDIASRAFTPSVDGYHQREVRSFLERVAGQVRASQSALPEGSTSVAEPTSAVQDREPRLAALERKLGELVADLEAATKGLRQAQPGMTAGAAAGLAGSTALGVHQQDQLQSERQALGELQASVRAQHEGLIAQQRSLSEQQQAFLAKQEDFDQQHQAFLVKQETLHEQQQAFVTSQQALAEQQQTLAEQQQSLSEQQEMLGEHLDDTRKLAAASPASATGSGIIPQTLSSPTPSPQPQSNPTPSPQPQSNPTPSPQPQSNPTPSPRPSVAAAAAAAEAETLSVFASDLDDQPLFSDSANDLLDGVLDDIMGNITDEGTKT